MISAQQVPLVVLGNWPASLWVEKNSFKAPTLCSLELETLCNSTGKYLCSSTRLHEQRRKPQTMHTVVCWASVSPTAGLCLSALLLRSCLCPVIVMCLAHEANTIISEIHPDECYNVQFLYLNCFLIMFFRGSSPDTDLLSLILVLSELNSDSVVSQY